jgi:hypothetical protein
MRAAQRLTRGQYINKHLPSLLYPSLFGSSFETKSSLDAASHNYATADGPSARSPFGGMKTHFGAQVSILLVTKIRKIASASIGCLNYETGSAKLSTLDLNKCTM